MVGTLLMVAVVVLTVTVFGVFSVGSMLDSSDEPILDVDGTLTDEGLELVHRGGDALAETDLQVLVRGDAEAVIDFEDGTMATVIADDGRFEPGERWRNDTDLPSSDELEVFLIHEPSNTIVYRETNQWQTATPSGTPTQTPGETPTATPTPTPTATPTATATPTPTPEPNQPPEANFTYSSARGNDQWNLDGSLSTDPDGDDDIVLYEWDLDGDGQFDDAEGELTKEKIDPGTEVTLRVTDSAGQTDTEMRVVE